MPQFVDAAPNDAETGERAAGLAEIWSRHLGRPIGPGASLLAEGIGSLDLIRILPDTRRYLGRHVSILDLISADTSANLVQDAPLGDAWMDVDTAAEIERDFAAIGSRLPAPGLIATRPPNSGRPPAIVVLGASGIWNGLCPGGSGAQAFGSEVSRRCPGREVRSPRTRSVGCSSQC